MGVEINGRVINLEEEENISGAVRNLVLEGGKISRGVGYLVEEEEMSGGLRNVVEEEKEMSRE